MRFFRFPILLLFFSVLSCSSPRGTVATVSFTGDIIMHIPVKTCSRQHNIIDAGTGKSANNHGFDFLFQEIKETLTDKDIVVGNMEFPIAPPYTSRPRIFNCHPAILASLKNAGFTMMHAANNHILDQDSEGVVATLNHLKEYKFDYIGADTDSQKTRNGLVKVVKGMRIGFLGYTGILNYAIPRNRNGYYINLFQNYTNVMEDIRNIKQRCDYLIMVAHTGEEYTFSPTKQDRRLMKQYIDAGVDLIVGHHPHVLQPIEKIVSNDNRECYIFYSLGNFISNQSSKFMLKGINNYISTRDSIILTLHLRKDEDKIKSHFTIEPIRTLNVRDKKNRRVIQPISYRDEISSLQKKYKEEPSLSGQKQIQSRINYLNNRKKAIHHILYGEKTFKNIEFIDTF